MRDCHDILQLLLINGMNKDNIIINNNNKHANSGLDIIKDLGKRLTLNVGDIIDIIFSVPTTVENHPSP